MKDVNERISRLTDFEDRQKKRSKRTDSPCLHDHVDVENNQQFYNLIPCRKIIENIHKLQI